MLQRNSRILVVAVTFLLGLVALPSFAAVGIFDNNVDIGVTGAAGKATYSGGEYEVYGSGAGIKSGSDAFHFVYQEMTGPFILSAKLDLDPYESNSQEVKVALMIRDSLDIDAAHFDAFVRNDYQTDTQWRLTTGGDLDRTSNYNWNHLLIPLTEQDGHLQIVRLGNTLMSYYISVNTGLPVLTETRVLGNLTDPVYVGLAVTSSDAGNSTVGYFSEVKLTAIPFLAQRIVPQVLYKGGTTISGIKVQLDGLTDATTATTVVENIPAGVTAVNVKTSVGTANLAGGKITWDLGKATGSAEMSYDLNVPTPGAPIVLMLTGDVTKGSETIHLQDIMLKHYIGLGPDWKIGANGVWAVIDGVLKHYADTGLDPKHIWVNKDFGTQDYTARADVMMTAWQDDDLARAGVIVRCDPNPDSTKATEMALSLLFHDDQNSVDILNDHIAWYRSTTDFPWDLNQLYTMTLTAEGTVLTASIVKKGGAATDVFDLDPVDDSRNTGRVGFPGLAGSTLPEVSAQFDNFEVLINGKVVFSDNFDVAVSIADWSVY